MGSTSKTVEWLKGMTQAGATVPNPSPTVRGRGGKAN
jgi:hypothetical protein